MLHTISGSSILPDGTNGILAQLARACGLQLQGHRFDSDISHMERINRINENIKKIGSRKDRKLKKYSDNFNEMFEFYLKIYRTGLITFCGVGVNVEFDINSEEGKFVFREYDNGRYKLTIPKTRHPNILKSVIIGKKGWGLWVKQWSQGIGDGTFTKYEILQEFENRNIKIPESFMIEFNNAIWKERMKNYELYKSTI